MSHTQKSPTHESDQHPSELHSNFNLHRSPCFVLIPVSEVTPIVCVCEREREGDRETDRESSVAFLVCLFKLS